MCKARVIWGLTGSCGGWCDTSRSGALGLEAESPWRGVVMQVTLTSEAQVGALVLQPWSDNSLISSNSSALTGSASVSNIASLTKIANYDFTSGGLRWCLLNQAGNASDPGSSPTLQDSAGSTPWKREPAPNFSISLTPELVSSELKAGISSPAYLLQSRRCGSLTLLPHSPASDMQDPKCRFHG